MGAGVGLSPLDGLGPDLELPLISLELRKVAASKRSLYNGLHCVETLLQNLVQSIPRPLPQRLQAKVCSTSSASE